VDQRLRAELQSAHGELRAAQLEASSLVGQLERARAEAGRARRGAERRDAALAAVEAQLDELEGAGHISAAARWAGPGPGRALRCATLRACCWRGRRSRAHAAAACRQRLEWAIHESGAGGEPPPLGPAPQRSESPRARSEGQDSGDDAEEGQQQQQQQQQGRASLKSHPLRSLPGSVANSLASSVAGMALRSGSPGDGAAGEQLQQLEQQLAAAREDLARNENIFAGQAQQLQQLELELREAQARAAQEEARLGQQLAAAQQEAARWRAQALQGARPGAAALAAADPWGAPLAGSGAGSSGSGRSSLTSAVLASLDGQAGSRRGSGALEDAEVLYDDELASYISDTDYCSDVRAALLQVRRAGAPRVLATGPGAWPGGWGRRAAAACLATGAGRW
jgi:hypothetical protein